MYAGNDCKYCLCGQISDVRRCTLGEEETVNTFLDYFNRGEVFGLFISSGVLGTPDATMERLNRGSKEYCDTSAGIAATFI